METIRTFLKPVIDLQGTGAQIKRLRKISGYSVHDLQMIFGFDYPQAIYAWDRERRLQAGKGAVQKEMGSPNYFKFTSEFKSAKI